MDKNSKQNDDYEQLQKSMAKIAEQIQELGKKRKLDEHDDRKVRFAGGKTGLGGQNDDNRYTGRDASATVYRDPPYHGQRGRGRGLSHYGPGSYNPNNKWSAGRGEHFNRGYRRDDSYKNAPPRVDTHAPHVIASATSPRGNNNGRTGNDNSAWGKAGWGNNKGNDRGGWDTTSPNSNMPGVKVSPKAAQANTISVGKSSAKSGKDVTENKLMIEDELASVKLALFEKVVPTFSDAYLECFDSGKASPDMILL